MSKADEMFKELGYKKSDYGYKITYTKSVEDEDFVIEIMIDGCDVLDRRSFGLQIQELQAINEKVKEFGWDE